MLGLSNTHVAATIANEKLVYLGQIADVVLVFAMLPAMVAAHHLDVLQFGLALVCVTHKEQTIVFEVGEGIDDGLGYATVGSFPIIKNGIHTDAQGTKIL